MPGTNIDGRGNCASRTGKTTDLASAGSSSVDLRFELLEPGFDAGERLCVLLCVVLRLGGHLRRLAALVGRDEQRRDRRGQKREERDAEQDDDAADELARGVVRYEVAVTDGRKRHQSPPEPV